MSDTKSKKFYGPSLWELLNEFSINLYRAQSPQQAREFWSKIVSQIDTDYLKDVPVLVQKSDEPPKYPVDDNGVVTCMTQDVRALLTEFQARLVEATSVEETRTLWLDIVGKINALDDGKTVTLCPIDPVPMKYRIMVDQYRAALLQFDYNMRHVADVGRFGDRDILDCWDKLLTALQAFDPYGHALVTANDDKKDTEI